MRTTRQRGICRRALRPGEQQQIATLAATSPTFFIVPYGDAVGRNTGQGVR